MTSFFRTGDYALYPQTGELVCGPERVIIRPKTCQLLILLMEAEGEVVSKADILARVWDDVIVDEQVVFQSIKELRKLFAGQEVIKTHPRKGYAWLLPVARVAVAPTPGRVRRRPTLAALLVGLSLVGLLALLGSQFWPSAPAPAGSILVLPVQTTLPDAEHRWLRFGLMDFVIRGLAAPDTLAVLAAEDVLAVLRRAGLGTEAYSATDIAQIFTVSGAHLVVEQRVTGSPKDYQLIYRLHRRTGLDHGAFLSGDVNQAAAQLVRKLNGQLGQLGQLGQQARTGAANYREDFNHALMASALEKMQAAEYVAAASLLQALVTTDTDSVLARQLLTQALVHGGEYAAAEQISAEALAEFRAQPAVGKEWARLAFWYALSLLQQGQVDAGIEQLTRAKDAAEQQRDWLYLGYVAEASGKVHQARADFGQARQAFEASMDYHQILQCPNGHANGLINLGELALREGAAQQARDYFDQALALASARELPEVRAEAEQWLRQLAAP